jgi:hypothetical protein
MSPTVTTTDLGNHAQSQVSYKVNTAFNCTGASSRVLFINIYIAPSLRLQTACHQSSLTRERISGALLLVATSETLFLSLC